MVLDAEKGTCMAKWEARFDVRPAPEKPWKTVTGRRMVGGGSERSYLHPGKLTAGSPKDHPIEKKNHLNQTNQTSSNLHFWVPC